MSGRRVVITGIGVVTPIGINVNDFFNNLMDGQTGVHDITRFDTSRCPVKTAAEIQDFDLTPYSLPSRDVRVLDRYQQYALAAADMAIRDAHLELPRQEIRGTKKSAQQFDRFGAAIGVAFSSTEVLEKQFKQMWDKGTKGVSPHLFNMALPNAATSVVSIRFALTGPLITVSGASASGTESIIAAYEKIKYNRADVMLAGGAESPVTEIIVSGFSQNQTGSKAGVCRPFDVHRDGTILGEGASIFVLEEMSHAQARNARIYGEILGYGMHADAYDMTDIPPIEAPGMTACLIDAIHDAKIYIDDVGYINVHGTATKMNDIAEVSAIKKVFGSHTRNLQVSGIKGSIGHMLGAAGGVELVAALLASCFDQVPPTYGLLEPDPLCDLTHVIGKGIAHPVNVAISTSVGMGGNNSAIVVKGEKLNL